MTAESLREKYVIAGIGHTSFGDLGGRSTLSMNVEACRNALADANVERDVVDAVFVKYPTSNFQSMYGQKVAERLGLHPRIGGVWDQAGASPASMIAFATMAIDAGQCEVASGYVCRQSSKCQSSRLRACAGSVWTIWLVRGCRGLRHDRSSSYARIRYDGGAVGRGRHGLPRTRQPQSKRPTSKTDDVARPPRVTVGGRAASPQRLLPHLRRRRSGGRDVSRSRRRTRCVGSRSNIGIWSGPDLLGSRSATLSGRY